MIVMAALGLLLSACTPRAPVEVDAASVEPKLYWSRSLQGQRVAVTGYVNFDNGGNSQAIAAGPELRTGAYGAGQKLISFAAQMGSGPNQIGSPKMTSEPMFKNAPQGVANVVSFSARTLSWRDAEGVAHPIGQPVRVTGRLRYAVSVMNDPRSPHGQRFRPYLTDVVLDAGY